MGNKNVAILFAGMPRHLHKCYQSHLNFFNSDVYNFDYFIHTWNECWWHEKLRNIDGENFIENPEVKESESLSRELQDIYSPKKIIVESQRKCKILNEDIKSIRHLSQRIRPRLTYPFGEEKICLDTFNMGQTYSMQQSCKLKCEYEKEMNFKYDYVFRFRLDCLIKGYPENFPKEENFKKIFKPNKLNFRWNEIKEGDIHLGDMFFGGSTELFNSICEDIYDYEIKMICEDLAGFSNDLNRWGLINCYTPEAIIGKRIKEEKMITDVNPHFPLFFPYRDYHEKMDNANWNDMYEKYAEENI
jgi:hypothetical protein